MTVPPHPESIYLSQFLKSARNWAELAKRGPNGGGCGGRGGKKWLDFFSEKKGEHILFDVNWRWSPFVYQEFLMYAHHPAAKANASLYARFQAKKCIFQGQNYGESFLKAYPTVPKKCMELDEILSI